MEQSLVILESAPKGPQEAQGAQGPCYPWSREYVAVRPPSVFHAVFINICKLPELPELLELLEPPELPELLAPPEPPELLELLELLDDLLRRERRRARPAARSTSSEPMIRNF